jgi:hypothetical protein
MLVTMCILISYYKKLAPAIYKFPIFIKDYYIRLELMSRLSHFQAWTRLFLFISACVRRSSAFNALDSLRNAFDVIEGTL